MMKIFNAIAWLCGIVIITGFYYLMGSIMYAATAEHPTAQIAAVLIYGAAALLTVIMLLKIAFDT